MTAYRPYPPQSTIGVVSPAKVNLLLCPVSDASLTTASSLSTMPTSAGSCGPCPEMRVSDLKAVAARIHPGVLALKARLRDHGAMGVLMSGSGSAVFAVWPDWESACAAPQRLRAEALRAEAVHTLAASSGVSE